MKIKQRGFSAIELMGTLLVVVFIIIVSDKTLKNMSKAREYNQVADQSKFYSQIAIRYITEHYRELYINKDGKVVTFSELKDFLPDGTSVPDGVSILTKYYHTPCLYVASRLGDSNSSTINAYLVFGNVNTAHKKTLDYIDARKIARNMGGNVGVLVLDGDKYIVRGGVGEVGSGQYSLPVSIVNSISSQCGFINNTLAENSLIIDLTKDKRLFNAIEGDLYNNNDSKNSNPTLARTGHGDAVTMQTNLYFDNVVKEASPNAAAVHMYRALDYGSRSALAPDQRIQIKAAAKNDSVATNDSQLNVNNAGLQAGYIAPMSHFIATGSKCESEELGKIAQQSINEINAAGGAVGGQLQCEFNPTFCEGYMDNQKNIHAGYCYLPTKSMDILYQFRPKTDATCPNGMMLANSQPRDNIDTTVQCPQPNPGVAAVVQGGNDGFYNTVTNMKIYRGYHTVCNYSDGTQSPIAALIKLQCTTKTNTYLVDNYRQQ